MKWNILIFAILIINVGIVWSQQVPNISHVTQKEIRDIGGEVNLACTVNDAGKKTVVWSFKEKHAIKKAPSQTLAMNSVLIVRDSRISLKSDAASATYKLTIKDLKETDAGLYQCQVISSGTVWIAEEVEVQVRGYPIIVENLTTTLDASGSERNSSIPTISYITQEQFRDIGDQVDLACSVLDAQDYPVRWLKYDRNGTEPVFLSTNSALIMRDSRLSLRFDAASATYKLSIKDLQESDAGLYQCQVPISPSVKVAKMVEVHIRRRSGSSIPTISNITQEQFKGIGDQVDLACSVLDAQDHPVLWLKYERNETEPLFLSTNSALIIRDSRLSLRFDAASATYTLSIRDLQLSDAGLYQCQVVISPSVKVAKMVEVHVQRQSGNSIPTISNITQEQFRYVGDQVDLACSVLDAQDYPVLWLKYDRNGTDPLFLSTNLLLLIRDSRLSLRFDAASATYTLSIRDIQEIDAGLYQCQVPISPSVKVAKMVEVHVRRRSGSSIPVISYITQEQFKGIGDQVDLACSVVDAQDYPVLWLKYHNNETEPFFLSSNSGLIIRDSRLSLRSDAASAYTSYTLSIRDLQESDSGLYKCEVLISPSVKVAKMMEVHVRKRNGSSIPTISNITQEQFRYVGDQVDLACSVLDAQNYPVLWIKYNRNETESLFLSTNSALIMRDARLSLRFDAASATYTLSIKDLRESDAGLYQCQVQISKSTKVAKMVEVHVQSSPIIHNSSEGSTTPKENLEARN